MIWNSFSDFWHMGGYGLYVWGSMGVTAAGLAIEVWLSKRGRVDAVQQVKDALQAQEMGKDWH